MNTATFDSTVTELHALARLAHDREFVLYQDDASDWYCAAAADPFAPYTLTGWSCTCARFLQAGACLHHAALLSRLGWLPPEPAPSSPPVWCGKCRRGVLHRGGTSHVPCACPAGDTFRQRLHPPTITQRGSRVMATIALAVALLAAKYAPATEAKPAGDRASRIEHAISVITHAGTDDAAIRLPSGQVLQLEYVVWHARHHDEPGYVIFEDGSPGILDEQGGTITGPDNVTRPFSR